jgi:hypothetical protein
LLAQSRIELPPEKLFENTSKVLQSAHRHIYFRNAARHRRSYIHRIAALRKSNNYPTNQSANHLSLAIRDQALASKITSQQAPTIPYM